MATQHERRSFPLLSWLRRERTNRVSEGLTLHPTQIELRTPDVDTEGRMRAIVSVQRELSAELKKTGARLGDSEVRRWIIENSFAVQKHLQVDTFTRLVFLGDTVGGSWTTAGWDDAAKRFVTTSSLQEWFSWNPRGVVVIVNQETETPRLS